VDSDDRRLLAAHDIGHLRAPNPGPYTLSGTNSWIIGRDPAYVIDPGPALGAHVEALAREVMARGGAGAILLTHHHSDHSGAAAALRERTGAPVAATRADADIALVDGATVGPLAALATPGHASDHVAFLAGRVCFSGDLVLGEGSVVLAPERGALVAYLGSLERLRGLDLDLIAPGHGPLISDPVAKLDEYRAHRLERERRLLEALAEGLRERDELLDRVWPDVAPALRAAAAATLSAHLGKLADEGRLAER
jgi:glyoxylase-like metal-dependent hydrolase (beta-lactamase superfamily II)